MPEAVAHASAQPGRPLDAATRVRFARALAGVAPGGSEVASGRTRGSGSVRKARISRAADAEEIETERLVTELIDLLDASDAEPPADPLAGESGLRAVRIHTDRAAHDAALVLGAHAFALGSDVFFASGRFAPATVAGDRLLLHELLHVVRNADMFEPVIFRNGGSDPGPPPTTISLSVSLDGVTLDFGLATYSAGRTRMQFFGLVLRRLLGSEYQHGLEERVLPAWQRLLTAANLLLINALTETSTAPAGRRIGQHFMSGAGALLLIHVLEQEFGLRVGISDAQRELLRLGVATAAAFEQLRPLLPQWYTPFMFRRQMAAHAGLLRRWAAVEHAADPDAKAEVIDAIFVELFTPIEVLERVRIDFEIANEMLREQPGDDVLTRANRRDSYVGYISLWNVSVAPDRPLTQAPQPVVRNQSHAVGFLNFVHTQPRLMEQALAADAHDVLVALVARYGRFTLRLSRAERGDERLMNRPARANAPPWDATLSSSPPLQPPLYDAALETDHAFTMQLSFAHWTDAFAMYRYRWEFMRVPNAPTGEEVPDMTVAAGQRPDRGTVLDTRLARARRYNAADIERVRRRLGGVAFGAGVGDLVGLNNALRTVGVYIRDFTERITDPRYTARMVFPEAGIYVVRCRAQPILEGDEEIVRTPSVALLPLIARDPDEMAVSRVQEARQTEFQARLRLAEIQALLASPFPPDNVESLRAESEELQSFLIEPGDALERHRAVLDKQIGLLERRLTLRRRIAELSRSEQPDQDAIGALRRELAELGGTTASALEDRELGNLRSRRDTLNDMIVTRDARRSRAGRHATRSTPHATFVSDLGSTIALALEIWDRGVVDGRYEVFISDLTMPDSGEAMGTSPVAGVRDPHAAAVLNGLKELLESSSDYGRGRVAIYVGNTIHTIPIAAGTGRLLSEALESGVTVLSIAAIVAAPFTQGASLYLLLPLGAVGAVPSAYRIYQRHEESRLRMDLAAVMDVVNVVAGVVGLAHAATPLRMVRMGRVLMVTGIGADGAGILLMGAGVVAQLDELRNLPEHERAARMLEIIGNAMLQIGIQAGGTIAHARYQGQRTRRVSDEPHHRAPGDEPGFHPPAVETAPIPRDAATPVPHDTSPSPADRAMTGSGRRSPGDAPAARTEPRPALPEAGAPEQLFRQLEQGIERALPPATGAGSVANPPPPGVFRRNLRTAEAAYRAYNDALAVSNGREVGIYLDPRTGEYRVMMGSETGVRAPEPHGWNAVLHFHPIPEGTLTYRLPSPQDFSGLLMRYFAEGRMVREFVEFDIVGVGRGRTEYGIDPAHAEPYFVRIHQPDGTSRTLRFAHDGQYRTYWGERTVYVEPGSPGYEAMIRDIQDFVRASSGEAAAVAPGASPSAAAPQAGSSGAPGAGARGMAGAPPTRRPADLQTAHGELTAAGVQLIRHRFRTLRENGRTVRLDTLSDVQIAQRYPNQSAWLEAVVTAEVRAQWVGRTTATDFAMTEPRQTLNDVAARLRTAIEEGRTGHTLHEPILNWSVWEYVQEMVRQNDPTLAPAFSALENLPNTPENRALRARWHEFKWSASRGDMSGFFLGKVGNKRPDIVEVSLSGDAIHITDASFAHNDPVHNFKSAFYRSVIERLTTVGTVTSTDSRSPLRQTPVGP